MLKRAEQAARARVRDQRREDWQRENQPQPQQYMDDDDDPFATTASTLDDSLYWGAAEAGAGEEGGGVDLSPRALGLGVGAGVAAMGGGVVKVVAPSLLTLLAVGSTMERGRLSHEAWTARQRYLSEKDASSEGEEEEVFNPLAVAKAEEIEREKRDRRVELGRLRPAKDWGSATARAKASAAVTHPPPQSDDHGAAERNNMNKNQKSATISISITDAEEKARRLMAAKVHVMLFFSYAVFVLFVLYCLSSGLFIKLMDGWASAVGVYVPDGIGRRGEGGGCVLI